MVGTYIHTISVLLILTFYFILYFIKEDEVEGD